MALADLNTFKNSFGWLALALFSAILSQSTYLSIYLSVFVRRFSPLQTAATVRGATGCRLI